MSTLSSTREMARAEASSFTFGRAMALLAGAVVVGIETSGAVAVYVPTTLVIPVIVAQAAMLSCAGVVMLT